MRTFVGFLSIVIPVGLVAIVLIEPMLWPRGTAVFDVLRIALALLGLAVVVGFIRHTLRSEAVPAEKRGLWVTVLLMGNIFVLPFFWFWYVRKSEAGQ